MHIQVKSTAVAVSLDDLLFENRNKKYGAYEIRLNYEKRLAKAITIAVSLFLLVLLIIHFLSPTVPEITIAPPASPPIHPRDTIFTIEHKKTFEGGSLKPFTKRALPVMSHDTADVDTATEIKKTPAPDLTKSDRGRDTATIAGNTGSDGLGKGVDDGTKTDTTEGDTRPGDETLYPDVEPEFPGGQAAYEKYLQENIKYPKFAEDEHIQGNILITFVVNEKGKVTDVQLVKGLSDEIDRNAIEAVRKMPDWIPGKAGRRNVKVRCNAKVKIIDR